MASGTSGAFRLEWGTLGQVLCRVSLVLVSLSCRPFQSTVSEHGGRSVRPVAASPPPQPAGQFNQFLCGQAVARRLPLRLAGRVHGMAAGDRDCLAAGNLGGNVTTRRAVASISPWFARRWKPFAGAGWNRVRQPPVARLGSSPDGHGVQGAMGPPAIPPAWGCPRGRDE
jgi:hypothetical protein